MKKTTCIIAFLLAYIGSCFAPPATGQAPDFPEYRVPEPAPGIVELYEKVEEFREEYPVHLLQLLRTLPPEIGDYAWSLSKELGIPFELLYFQIQYESGWNPRIVGRPNRNGTRDYGLAQLNSQYIGIFIEAYYTGTEPFDPFHPNHSLEIGMKLLRDHYAEFGDWRLALYAYNAGRGAVLSGRIPSITIRYANYVLGKVEALS